jgi:RNA polymerase sigma factor (sigma-70 family)
MSALDQIEAVELVKAVAARRDREAFARLFDHFTPRLEAFLIRSGLDPTGAEEVSQDVMLVLWQKAELFDPSLSGLGTWLFRIARNRRIDLARRARLDYRDPSDIIFESQSLAPEADTIMDRQQREALVRAAMTELPVEQLDLVRLAFIDGLSHNAIAEQTGQPLGTVKSRLRLAFQRLRRALEAKGVTQAV